MAHENHGEMWIGRVTIPSGLTNPPIQVNSPEGWFFHSMIVTGTALGSTTAISVKAPGLANFEIFRVNAGSADEAKPYAISQEVYSLDSGSKISGALVPYQIFGGLTVAAITAAAAGAEEVIFTFTKDKPW